MATLLNFSKTQISAISMPASPKPILIPSMMHVCATGLRQFPTTRHELLQLQRRLEYVHASLTLEYEATQAAAIVGPLKTQTQD